MNYNEKAILSDWVHQFTNELFAWALYKTGSKENAEDLVQDTFLSAFSAFDTFTGQSSPKTWLFRILNNKIVDSYRRSKKIPLELVEDAAKERFDKNFNAETGMWNEFEAGQIWSVEEKHLLDDPKFQNILAVCLDNLPLKWNIALTSKYLSEKKSEEICKELDLTASNYWQIIHRAKLLLRQCIEKKYR